MAKTHKPTLIEAFDRAVAAHGTVVVTRTLKRGEQIGVHPRWLDQSYVDEMKADDDREQRRYEARARRVQQRIDRAAGVA